MISNPDRVLIFDTTLRDGEQSPGCSMTQPEKLRVARALAELGVDVIEAGFPAASRGDFDSVSAVAREVEGPVVCALARCHDEDIELAARALAAAEHRRLHVFLATSAIHRQYKLNMAQEEILRLAAAGVGRARELCEDVEFSPEDASRTELEFLAQVVEVAIAARILMAAASTGRGYCFKRRRYWSKYCLHGTAMSRASKTASIAWDVSDWPSDPRICWAWDKNS